jgi:dipeptidyl aminopeptidase/acylaminoacyl peptidase
MLMNVHGGPEGQSRPGFQGRSNYLLNEMGVAIFYPNVRGSTGYGKNFVGLDNGPFKRENSVKDMGAFLSALGKDASLDASRLASLADPMAAKCASPLRCSLGTSCGLQTASWPFPTL